MACPNRPLDGECRLDQAWPAPPGGGGSLLSRGWRGMLISKELCIKVKNKFRLIASWSLIGWLEFPQILYFGRMNLMRPGNEADYRSVEPFEERVRRLAHEFSELERLRLDIQKAEEMLKSRSKLAGRASKNR
jgi:hypothetical protein